MRTWITYLTAFLLLFSSWSTSAQTSAWDSALDRYERICNQCIDLRQRSLSGEAVPAASVTELLGQLASLRNTLQESAGQMTPSQRARFESIRLRYSEAFSSTVQARTFSFRPALPPSSGLPVISPPGLAASGRSVALKPQAFPAPQATTGAPLSENDFSRSAGARFGIIAFGAFPVARPGVMARVDIGRAGLYAKGSWRPSEASAYNCYSDGTTARGFIWTSGRESYGALSISAGASYAVIPNQPGNPLSLRVYAGAGYGSRTVLWEDASGRWAKVSDLSPGGLSADAGLLLDIGHFSLMAGVSTVSFQTLGLELGLGFLF